MTAPCGPEVRLEDVTGGPYVFNGDPPADCPGQLWVMSTPIDGWDSTGVLAGRSDRIREDGVKTLRSYASGRAMTLQGAVEYYPPDTEEDIRTALAAAFDFITIPACLKVDEAGVPKQITVRRSGQAIIRPVTPRVIQFSVPVIADDPLKRSQVLNAIGVATTGPVTNAGTHNVFPTLIISGGLSASPAWTISNDAVPGKAIGIQGLALGGGDTLRIDMNTMEVTLNGADAFDNLQAGYQRWPLVPGLQTLTMSRAKTFTVEFRDGYL